VRFKVLSLTNARSASESTLNVLTEKQCTVLTNAYKLGYYDLPRRIDSEQLARRLNLSRATLVVHCRKAEKRVLAEIMEGNVQL
jgi:predicted DNA binding protein